MGNYLSGKPVTSEAGERGVGHHGPISTQFKQTVRATLPAAALDGWPVRKLPIQFFEQFKLDYALFDVSALDHDGGLLDFDLAEARVWKEIIRYARRPHGYIKA